MNKTTILHSLIKESIQEYIREVEFSGNVAAQEAKIKACEEAIAIREKKVNMEGLDESYHDLMDPGKIGEIKKEIKELQKFKTKAEGQLKKMKDKREGKKEITTDAVTEEAPVDEADVTAQMEMSDEGMKEEALNESFLKMQKLAGVITESQYNSKKSLS